MSGEQSPKATRDSWQLLLFQSGGIKSHCLPPQKTLLFEQESDIFFWEKPGVTDCIDSVTNPVCIWNYHHHHHQLNTNWKIWNRTKADSFRLKRWVDDWPPLHVYVATKMLMLPPHQKSSSRNSHNAVACDISPLSLKSDKLGHNFKNDIQISGPQVENWQAWVFHPAVTMTPWVL